MKSTILFLLLVAGFIFTGTGAKAQVPKLSSYPSATATIFLDFDGQYVTGTSWNWYGPINAEAAVLTTEAIAEIFNRVAEDFRPFNLNITTDSTVYLAAPFNKRTHLIITPTSAWYGNAGGVAFVGSFKWGDETPAWVFSSLLANNTKYVAEACSHEAGHTLGLQHQSIFDSNCGKTAEYSGGQGSGEIGWAPIMGVGYYKNLTTWHTGTSSIGCNTIQNDLNVIAGLTNNFGFRTDDNGNTPETATAVDMQGQSFMVNGLINNPDDVDAFKIELGTSTVLRVNAIPQNVGNNNQGANIDIKIIILNSTQDTIGTYNPSTLLSAGIDTNLTNGTYYIVVKATGNINHSEYGSLGYYSITGTLMTVLRVRQFLLKGIDTNGSHFLSWSYLNEEPVKHITVEISPDGKQFEPLVVLDASIKTFSYKSFSTANYYRLKATLADETAYYSNIANLRSANEYKSVQLFATVVHESIVLNSEARHAYQLYDATGKLLTKGNLEKGINHIDVSNAPNGMLFMRLIGGIQQWTEKLIKE